MSGNQHSAPIPVNTKSNPSPTTLPTLSGRYLRVDGSDRHVAADRSGPAEQLDGLGAARVSRIAASPHRAVELLRLDSRWACRRRKLLRRTAYADSPIRRQAAAGSGNDGSSVFPDHQPRSSTRRRDAGSRARRSLPGGRRSTTWQRSAIRRARSQLSRAAPTSR